MTGNEFPLFLRGITSNSFVVYYVPELNKRKRKGKFFGAMVTIRLNLFMLERDSSFRNTTILYSE
jgi:hypothetical protein